MSLFGRIMDKIFHHPTAAPTQTAPSSPAASATLTPVAAPVAAPVDVEAVLTAMAANGNGGNWQTSIVDLLKLLDLDSSLAARKDLANELNIHVGEDGTAEENIALHKAVMTKLAQNGGKVPESMKN
ncbi:MAG: DUF3597 domain-containing protein [Sphingomonadaceae bacterium]|nr:DUF3597 domain-containing protein [Sphingomonadaceae bacterium]